MWPTHFSLVAQRKLSQARPSLLVVPRSPPFLVSVRRIWSWMLSNCHVIKDELQRARCHHHKIAVLLQSIRYYADRILNLLFALDYAPMFRHSKLGCHGYRQLHTVHRRSFLQLGALGSFGLSLPGILYHESLAASSAKESSIGCS